MKKHPIFALSEKILELIDRERISRVEEISVLTHTLIHFLHKEGFNKKESLSFVDKSWDIYEKEFKE